MGPLGVLVDSQVCGGPSSQVCAVDVQQRGPGSGAGVSGVYHFRRTRMGPLNVLVADKEVGERQRGDPGCLLGFHLAGWYNQ